MSSKKKYSRLLVIDSNVTVSSPSMRGWIRSIEIVCKHFDEIEIWSAYCELADHPKVKWVPFKTHKVAAVQGLHYGFQVANKIRKQAVWPPEDTLVQVTGFITTFAHVRFTHYSHHFFQQERKKRSKFLSLSLPKRILSEREAWRERRILKKKNTTMEWWVVSRKLGEMLHQMDTEHGGSSKLRILPNAYDPAVYSGQARTQNRDERRKFYGIEEDEIVFVFSGFAHFDRKGLVHAIEAIKIARDQGAPFRLLVFGGTEKYLESYKKKLVKNKINSEGTTFVGMVTEMEKNLSVGDALLFPSHFEAFSLAEIEAAAMGLRLYLTPHYGTEMILREPVNGRFIKWEPEKIAEVLIEDWQSKVLGTFHNEMGEALEVSDYEAKWDNYYSEINTCDEVESQDE